jgi:LPXTG-motif cell wall-anchored protein
VRARTLLLAAAVLVFAAPAAAPAQTPGDEQYTDPFGGSTPAQPEPSDDDAGGGSEPAQPEPSDDDAGGGGGSGDSPGDDTSGSAGGGGSTGSPGAGTAPTGPDAPVTSAGSTTGTAAPVEPVAAEQLPATGADTRLMVLVGALLLAGGVAIRVRLRQR